MSKPINIPAAVAMIQKAIDDGAAKRPIEATSVLKHVAASLEKQDEVAAIKQVRLASSYAFGIFSPNHATVCVLVQTWA